MTDAELIAQWNAAKNQPVSTTATVDPDLDKQLVQKWNERENYLKRTGGAAGGAERFGASALNALMTELPIGVAQMLGTADPKALNRMRAENEVHTATNAGRLGNVVGASVLPMAVGAGVGGALSKVPGLANAVVTRNALGGAASGAVLPTMDDESRGANILSNAALSALPALARRVTQPIRPTADAQKLIDAKIYPTPGQAHGGWLNRFESASTSHPILGSTISEARRKPFEAYVGQRQKSFGYEGDKLGREATQEMAGISEGNYDRVLPKLSLQDTPALRAKYLRAQNELDPQYREHRDVGQFIERKFDPLGDKSPARIIGGEDFNTWQSQLRKRAEAGANSDDVFKQDLSNAYKQMRKDTFAAIDEQGLVAPEVAQEFADARKYYGNMKDLMNLNSSGGARVREGMFTPAEDLRWMEKKSPEAFQRNAMPDQDLAQAGVNTLGAMPDSGTAGRLAMLDLIKDPKQVLNPMSYLSLPLTAGTWEPVRKFAVGAYAPQRALTKALRAFDNPLIAQPLGTLETEGLNEYNR